MSPTFTPGEICWITGRYPLVRLWPAGVGGPVVIEQCARCGVKFWRPRKEARHRC